MIKFAKFLKLTLVIKPKLNKFILDNSK